MWAKEKRKKKSNNKAGLGLGCRLNAWSWQRCAYRSPPAFSEWRGRFIIGYGAKLYDRPPPTAKPASPPSVQMHANTQCPHHLRRRCSAIPHISMPESPPCLLCRRLPLLSYLYPPLRVDSLLLSSMIQRAGQPNWQGRGRIKAAIRPSPGP